MPASTHDHALECDQNSDGPGEPTARWNDNAGHLSEHDTEMPDKDGVSSTSDGLLVFYQRYLRRPKTREDEGCPFQPSCSAYARQSYDRYGAVGGTVLTIDRLFVREHQHAAGNYEVVCTEGDQKLLDTPPGK